jgi:hypothetical protein
MCQHGEMRRHWLLPTSLVVLVLAGCGATSSPPATPVPPVAGEQGGPVSWIESIGSPGSRFVFRVSRFTVGRDGWQAQVSVTNDTSVAFIVAARSETLADPFGLMLFRTGAEDELDRRNAGGTMPAVRAAQAFNPRLPATLAPRATWTGVISARGALPVGYWVRLVFGAFIPEDVMPKSLYDLGVRDELTWITDHTYRLRA